MVANVAELISAYDNGKSKYSYWRKVPTQTTGSGIWFDLSMSPGSPIPNYYIGSIGTSTGLARSTDGGLDHGPNVSPAVKYLHKFLAMAQTTTAVPLPLIVADYIMFYPFIGQDAGDFSLTNSTTLQRYTDGVGVQVMPVLVAGQTGGQSFYITYTNSNGVAGRVSRTVTCNTQTVNGTIIHTAPATAGANGPFIPLQQGDSGVRSIETVTYLGSDVGLMTLVLVKPLLTTAIYDITAPVEVDCFINQNQLPIIKDDAFLGMIAHPSGTLASAALNGELQTFWS